MKLLALHVENFGTLHQLDDSFNDGLNTRLYPNGWGKSTLAVFIKAMLYGLPQTTQRSLIANERKRYAPWQGGVFGGSLDVEVGGVPYRIERTFGVKAAEDTLRVVSLQSGHEVDEPWAKEVGLALFGVDADAYERSTYLSQRPDEYTKDGALGIHTKLNRLVDATDDIANYDTAMTALDKRRQYYRLLKGEGGVIFQNRQRLDGIQRNIDLAAARLQSLDECRTRIREIEGRISEERQALDRLEQSERELHRLGEAEAVWERIKAVQNEIEQLQQEHLAVCREMGGDLPDENLLISLEQAADRQQALKISLARLEGDEGQRTEYAALVAALGTDVPSADAQDRLRQTAQDYHSAASRITDTERQEALGTAEELSADEQLRRARALCDKPERDTAQETADKARRPVSLPILTLVGGGLLTLALLLASLLLPSLLIAAAAALLLTALLTLVVSSRQRERARHLSEVRAQEAQAQDLTARLLQEAEARLAFTRAWHSLAPGLECPDAKQAYFSTERLLGRLERLSQLQSTMKQREAGLSSVNEQLTALDQAVRRLLAPMPGAPAQARQAAQWLGERLQRHADLTARLASKTNQLNELKAQYADDSVLIALTERVQNESEAIDLTARRATLAGERERAQTALDQDVQQLAAQRQLCERLEGSREELDELESERDTLIELIERQELSLDAIVSAQKYLKQAKEALSGRYLTAMKERFAAYMRELSGNEALDFTMNTRFEVSLRVMGSGRDTDSFSVGTRDLIAFCQRLSLVDAMFEGERPFLILDDPFTNLDDATLQAAQALVDRLSERYQLIYLSCHSGRVPQQTKE